MCLQLSNRTWKVNRISAPGDAIPHDAPAAIAFDSRSKSPLILNHEILSANPAHFAVLRMFVGNPGNPLDKPILP